MNPKQEAAYRQLGFSEANATWDDIRTSYRRKVQQLHPDRVDPSGKQSANQDEFILVTQAYKLLKETWRREKEFPDGKGLGRSSVDDDESHLDNGDYMAHANSRTVSRALIQQAMQPSAHPTTIHILPLKMVFVTVFVSLVGALSIVGYISWQKTQIPPLTPFTATTPQPLSEGLSRVSPTP